MREMWQCDMRTLSIKDPSMFSLLLSSFPTPRLVSCWISSRPMNKLAIAKPDMEYER